MYVNCLAHKSGSKYPTNPIEIKPSPIKFTTQSYNVQTINVKSNATQVGSDHHSCQYHTIHDMYRTVRYDMVRKRYELEGCIGVV